MTKSQKLLTVAQAVKRDAGVKHHVVLPDSVMEQAFSNFKIGLVVAAKGDTPKSLAILAHEAGHVATTDQLQRHKHVTLTETEFEASRWGFEHIRKNGGKTTEEMETFARQALLGYAVQDSVNGAPRPSTAALQFLRGNLDI